MHKLVGAAVAAMVTGTQAFSGSAGDEISRGKYLVGVIGCADCHSPHTTDGALDLPNAFSGGMGFEVPGLGVYWAPNLTPASSGLGAWSEAEIVQAIRTGTRPDGRKLIPIMPWTFYADLTDDDVTAIARYLKSLAPIENAVPAPIGPGEAAPAPYLALVMPSAPKS